MPRDDAHKILEIYAYFGTQPGGVLISNHFLAAGLRRRWTADELDRGLMQALDSGWVQRADTGGWQLTTAGFQEASVATA